MAHTPGPWTLEAGRNIVTEHGTFYITYGRDRHNNPLWKTHFAELDDNARLIAAAPDLLAACERAASYLKSHPNVQNMSGPEYGIWHQLASCLDKAKGA